MSDHYGNLNIYGRLAISQNLSAGYQFPDEIGESFTVLGIDNNSNNKLIFLKISDLIDNSILPQTGNIECEVDKRVYEINFNAVSNATPIVSLVIPSSSSDLFVQGIFDVTESSFKVALSNTPDVSGYKINWMVK